MHPLSALRKLEWTPKREELISAAIKVPNN